MGKNQRDDDDNRALLPDFRDLLRRGDAPITLVDLFLFLFFLGLCLVIAINVRRWLYRPDPRDVPHSSGSHFPADVVPAPSMPESVRNEQPWTEALRPTEALDITGETAKASASRAAEQASTLVENLREATAEPSSWIPQWAIDTFELTQTYVTSASDHVREFYSSDPSPDSEASESRPREQLQQGKDSPAKP